VGCKIRLRGVGDGSPLVAFLQIYSMPHKNFPSTQYILGGDSSAHLLAFRRKSVPSFSGQKQ